MTQQQMYEHARKQLAGKLALFMAMQQSDNPITVEEMRILVAKRPDVYAFLRPFIDKVER